MPALRAKLLEWFTKYGANSTYEIEARVKDVSQLGFEAVLAKMKGNKGWSNTPAEEMTLDMMHASGVRETQPVRIADGAANGASTFLRKTRVDEPAQTETPGGHMVRFACASEREGGSDGSEVHTYRYKKRVKFVHKKLFSFELTRVWQGPTAASAKAAEPLYEVELEFCGQELWPADADRARHAQYLTDSMLMKVADLVRQVADAANPPAQGGGGLKRRRPDEPASGELRPGEVVTMAPPGAAVALEPSVPGAPPPFDGELPAELATTVTWVLAGVEPAAAADGGRAATAQVMNLPCAIGERRFPLYYLCGTVPLSALGRMQQRR